MNLQKRIDLSKVLLEKGISALVVTSIENNYYVSSFYPFSKKLIPQVSVFSVYFPKNGNLKYVFPTIDLPSVFESGISAEQVFTYGAFRFNEYSSGVDISENVSAKIGSIQNSPVDALSTILTQEGLTDDLVSVEYRGLVGNDLILIKEKNPEVTFIDGTSLIDQLRIIKSNEEIALLSKASSIAESSLLYTFESLKIGMSELEANQICRKHIIEQGGVNTFAVFTFASRAAFSDTASLSTNKLSNGGIIRADVGCSYAGYHADMSRSAVMGKCDDQTLALYTAIQVGEVEAIEIARSGVECSEVYHMAINATRNAGLSTYNRHHCGHGIGLICNEAPLISANNKTKLQDGMVICVETPYYRLGWGGLQVEDTIVIKDEGNILLTNSPRHLYRL